MRSSRSSQFRRALTCGIATLVLAAVALVPLVTSPDPAGAIGTPVMGPSRLSGAQIAAWFRAKTGSAYRASVPIDQLAATFVSEGAAANVRGDIAFAQSVLETGWFSFPAGGYVQPGDNNFAGIGAYGDGSQLFRAPSAQIGVRGQIQLLRRYADAASSDTNIGYPPVSQLWNPASRYDVPGGTHGWAPTWEDMSTRWASSPSYTTAIMGLYKSMLTFNGLVATTDLSTTPFGSFDVATRGIDTVTVAGWAIDPTTTSPIPVHVYVDGVGAAILTANVPRPDVAAAVPGAGANHGYLATVPVAAGIHTVCTYGISASGGPNTQLGCKAITGNPIGSFDMNSARVDGVHVAGWAIAPETASPIAVHIYVDGVGTAILTANLSRPDVGNAFSGYGSNHGFDVTLPLEPANHTVCAYAINPNPGAPNTTLGCTAISGPPFGSFDTVTTVPGGIRVGGWAIAPTTIAPTVVHIYVDGVGAAILTANTARPDVGSVFAPYGSAHGFDATVSTAPGSRMVCAYGISPVASAPNSVLGCKST